MYRQVRKEGEILEDITQVPFLGGKTDVPVRVEDHLTPESDPSVIWSVQSRQHADDCCLARPRGPIRTRVFPSGQNKSTSIEKYSVLFRRTALKPIASTPC